MWLSRTLICLGLIADAPSVWETLSFSWNPDFQAPRLPLGPTHPTFHAFREFTLTVGVEIVLLYVIFQPAERRIKALWNVMSIAAVGYYGGWWLPWPFLDLHAPTPAAEIDHLVATLLSLTGVAFAWKYFPNTTRNRKVIP